MPTGAHKIPKFMIFDKDEEDGSVVIAPFYHGDLKPVPTPVCDFTKEEAEKMLEDAQREKEIQKVVQAEMEKERLAREEAEAKKILEEPPVK